MKFFYMIPPFFLNQNFNNTETNVDIGRKWVNTLLHTQAFGIEDVYVLNVFPTNLLTLSKAFPSCCILTPSIPFELHKFSQQKTLLAVIDEIHTWHSLISGQPPMLAALPELFFFWCTSLLAYDCPCHRHLVHF